MALKPSDRYIAKLLDLNEAEYQHFLYEAQRIAATGPQPAVTAGLVVPILINVALSLGSLALASLFAPKAPGKPPTITTSQQQGKNRTENQRYAPTSGFDSFQEIAKLQSTIPVIYAFRETIANSEGIDERFGGIRVNLQLLWSQMLSFRNHQMFRGIFLVGEGEINSLDPRRFALGDTALTGYELQDLAATSAGARYSVYFRRDGGRIVANDLIAGRAAASDGGNSMNAGASDVYHVFSTDNVLRPDACMASTPTATIVFGVYSPIGNNLAYRVNPTIRPTITLGVVSAGKGDGSQKYRHNDDTEALISIWKSRLHWSPQAAILRITNQNGSSKTGERVDVVSGDRIYYHLLSESDAKTKIQFKDENTNNSQDADQLCGDIASGVAARQNSADDALVLDSLYRIGSCWAVLESRSPSDKLFVSEAANDPVKSDQGVSIVYTFRVVKPGVVEQLPNALYLKPKQRNPLKPDEAREKIRTLPNWSLSKVDIQDEDRYGNGVVSIHNTATNFAQIFRLAVATFTVPRPCRVFEIGIRSRVGIQVGGLCNFRDAKNLTEVDTDALAGRPYEDPFDQDVNVSTFQSGSVSRREIRYSFFRLLYRTIDTSVFTEIPLLFGVAGDTSQDVFNYIRVEMQSIELWETSIEPVSGWEIRNGIAQGNLSLLDSSLSSFNRRVVDIPRPDLGPNRTDRIFVCFHGIDSVAREADTFRMTLFDAPKGEDLYMGWSDFEGNKSMIDGWGRLAEMFVYDEIQSSCSSGPEHSISYINTITPNPSPPPNYDNLAIVGLNIRSSTELQQLGQLSAYISSGIRVQRLLNDSEGPSHNWPNALYDAALNGRYGTGDRMTPEQINRDSFVTAARWTRDRRYFFDGVIESPRNLRQWAADMAPMFLLTFGEIGGQWYLAPAITFEPVVISGLFTAGNIYENTFKLNWIDADDRQPVRVSANWRQERSGFSIDQPGLFPVDQEVLVEEVGLPANAQTLTLPMSEFCTNKKHAIDACKLVARFRRYTDHRVSFETTYDIEHAAVAPDRYIRVEMGETFVSGWNNGMCAADGQVTSTAPLADGSYPVIAWNGNGATAPAAATLTVRAGVGSLPGQVFAVVEQQQETRTYRVESVRPLDDGRFAVSAVHAPTGPDGVLLMAADWGTDKTDANWRISP